MSELKSLAEFIRETREKAGFSVVGLAKKTGLTIEQLEDIDDVQSVYFNMKG